MRGRHIELGEPVEIRKGLIGPVATVLLAVALLAGCTSTGGGLLDGSPGEGDYVSTDGSTTAILPANRGEPVDFATTVGGTELTAEEFRGQVVVLNFWYADCPPCRLEAADLEALHQEYADTETVFLGVNVRDSMERARSFTDEFGVSYPTILDASDNAVQLAFVGSVSPNAVPTTLVLDRKGRVAARVSGLVSDPDLLGQFIDDALAESADTEPAGSGAS